MNVKIIIDYNGGIPKQTAKELAVLIYPSLKLLLDRDREKIMSTDNECKNTNNVKHSK